MPWPLRPLRIVPQTEGERREPLKIDLSKQVIDTIRPPATGRTCVYDAKQIGLALMVTENDAPLEGVVGTSAVGDHVRRGARSTPASARKCR